MAERDPERAREQAAARLEQARRVSETVDRYHRVADTIDDLQRSAASAAAERAAALFAMRDLGLTIAEIAELTGLPSSRVQAFFRHDGNGAGDGDGDDSGLADDRWTA
jgi:DNA-directed RNA polymerase specialized sigma24 family protein